MLDRIMFYHLIFSPLVVKFVCVRSKAYVCPCLSDDIIINEVFKGDIFEFIGLRRTKNWIALCELHQD